MTSWIYFGLVTITRGNTSYNKPPDLFWGHCLHFNTRQCTYETGDLKAKRCQPIKFIRCRKGSLSVRVALWPCALACVCGQKTTLHWTVGDYTTLWITLSVSKVFQTQEHSPGPLMYLSYNTVNLLGEDVNGGWTIWNINYTTAFIALHIVNYKSISSV